MPETVATRSEFPSLVCATVRISHFQAAVRVCYRENDMRMLKSVVQRVICARQKPARSPVAIFASPLLTRVLPAIALLPTVFLTGALLTGILSLAAPSAAAAPAPARVRKAPAPKPKKEAPTAAPLCQSKDVTVELPRDFLQLSVLSNSFIARDNSISVITFQNYFPQPIAEMAIVAEYQDQDGELIFSSVFAASANPTVTPSWFSTYLPSQYYIAPWTKPVAPRATFSLAATSGLTTAACPAQIKATVVHIAFAGGSQLNYSTPGWQLPIQPEQIPGDLEFYAPPRELPLEFTVKVHQPAPLGPIIPPPEVTLVDGKPGAIFGRIRDQMQAWRFAFAIKNGVSVDGDETLLIRVHSAKEGDSGKVFWLTREEVPAPMGIVDLIPLKIPDTWAVYYGGVNLMTGATPPQMQ
jgi:hypothetical protein